MTKLRLAIVGAGPAGIYAADILLKAERKVCFDCVQTSVLKCICLELVYEANASAFLPHVEHHSPALFLDLCHSRIKLLATVTSERSEAVSRETLGMNPAKHRLTICNISLYERHVVLAV